MALSIEIAPEQEARLHDEAAKRGLSADEFVRLLLEDFLQPSPSDEAEAARLAAIDEALGACRDAPFSSDDLHRERQRGREHEEAQFQTLFGERQ